MGAKPIRWGSSAIAPALVDPTGQMNVDQILPGYEGTPYRGPVVDLKRDDAFRKQPQQYYKVHIEQLDLSIKDDVERYREVCQTIMNGFGQASKEDIQYDPEAKNWRVLLRWMEFFSAMQKGEGHGQFG